MRLNFLSVACPQGISAVKAIGLAVAQGQKIYTITQEVYRDNPNIVNSNLSALSYSTKQGIQNALAAGHEVTIHERPITQSGWTGAGYIFTDPQTGAGGYIIDGGSNGGWLAGFSQGVSIAASIMLVALVAGSGGLAGIALAIILAYFIAALQLIVAEYNLRGKSDEYASCYNGGIGAGEAIGSLILGVISGLGILSSGLKKVVATQAATIASFITGVPLAYIGMELGSTDRPTCFK